MDKVTYLTLNKGAARPEPKRNTRPSEDVIEEKSSCRLVVGNSTGNVISTMSLDRGKVPTTIIKSSGSLIGVIPLKLSRLLLGASFNLRTSSAGKLP
jgi:hypothetical protein